MTTARATGDRIGPPVGGVPVLELDNVSKVYPGQSPVRAIDQVSLAVAVGELVAVVGPSEVKAGDAVTVTLPDGTTTPGVVSSVGAVATTTSSQQGQGPITTIPVQVKLTDPRAEGTLDQAPVTVNITTASSGGPVLAVPVTALMAQAPGGYQVEVVGPGNTRRWVTATPGIFDDANGLVQITGNLTPGERVVVAS